MNKAFLLCILFSLLSLATAILIVLLFPHGQHPTDSDNSSQDFCVADLSSGVTVDGFTCKPSTMVEETDFFFSGLAIPSVTNNTMRSSETIADVHQLPGLNTLGISMSRIDFSPGGLNPPHLHPRATEIMFVLDGHLDVGFITTGNKLIIKTLSKGELFIFPRGLVHYQKNHGDTVAVVIAAFNSQLPGTQSVAVALFEAAPTVPEVVLSAAFRTDVEVVGKIKSRLARRKELD